MTSGLTGQITAHRLVPVIVLQDAGHAKPLGETLIAGGLPVAEVTFRTEAAEASIRAMAALPDLLVGAGTVLTTEQVQRAADAGAKFVVTPGTNPPVIEACLKLGLPVFPGVMTPSEIDLAASFGLQTLKFFPAGQAGGPTMLKALAGPYSQVKFIPTGGVNAGNLGDYLGLPNVAAVGGSWMVNPKQIAAGNFAAVQGSVAQAVGLACEH